MVIFRCKKDIKFSKPHCPVYRQTCYKIIPFYLKSKWTIDFIVFFPSFEVDSSGAISQTGDSCLKSVFNSASGCPRPAVNKNIKKICILVNQCYCMWTSCDEKWYARRWKAFAAQSSVSLIYKIQETKNAEVENQKVRSQAPENDRYRQVSS